jgi:hypothetical protein
MRKKSYLSFKDLRVFYDKKNDSIRLTSGDPELAVRGWSLTLNRDSKDERILREALIEAGIAPSEREIIQEQERTRAELQASIRQRPERIDVGEVRDVDVEAAGYEQLAQDPEYQADQERRKQLRDVAGRILKETQAKHGTHSKEAQLAAIDALATLDLDLPMAKDELRNDLQHRIPTAVPDAGWIGPYIGHTTRAGMEPVFLRKDSGSRDGHPSLVVVGEPGHTVPNPERKIEIFSGVAGSGKSFTPMILTEAQLQAQPDTALVVIDPQRSMLPGITAIAKSTIAIDVLAHPGLLNPFVIFRGMPEQTLLTTAAVMQLLGGLVPTERQELVRAAVSQQVAQSVTLPTPSLRQLLEDLIKYGPQDMAPAFHLLLKQLGESLFGETLLETGAPLDVIGDETIIYEMRRWFSEQQLPRMRELAAGVITLLGARAMRQLQLVENTRERLLLAEYASEIGAHMIGWGMLRDTAKAGVRVLLSQRPGDPDTLFERLKSFTRTFYVFRETDPKRIDAKLRAVNMKTNSFNRSLLRNLQTGECLVVDAVTNSGPTTMQFVASERLRNGFSGNPTGWDGSSFTIFNRPGVQRQRHDARDQAELILQVADFMRLRLHAKDPNLATLYPVSLLVYNLDALLVQLPVKMPTGEHVSAEQVLASLGKIARHGREVKVVLGMHHKLR